MMRIRTAFIAPAIFFVLVLSSYAQSQPPSSRPPEISLPKQEHTGGSKAPSKTKQTLEKKEVIPDISSIKSVTQENQERPESDKPKGNEKAPSDWWLAVFTGVLAVVAMIQALFLRRQNTYFERIERAYIFVDVDAHEDATGHCPPPVVAITMRNLGKTPAILIKLQVCVDEKPTVYPAQKSVHALNNIIAQGAFIMSGEWKTIDVQYSLTTEAWAKIKQGEKRLICYGSVEYKDVFHITRKTGFCWETSPLEVDRAMTNPNFFAMSHNKELNYYK